ncbi:MAG: FHA domain-containing protein [Bacteroidetes bacterium]|nr:FHA domain-containing protein [Bacteroidota bacterium]MCW5895204.1 FHA domain-containing protein [Bacteroidota bacterium]
MDTKIVTKQAPTTPPHISIRIERDSSPTKKYEFTHDFKIGRDAECDVMLKETASSRVHAKVEFVDGRWWYEDLKSTNGSFKEGVKIERIPLTRTTRIGIGINGPLIYFTVEGEEVVDPTSAQGQADPSLSGVIKHYFDESSSAPAGERTQMVRRAFKHVSKKQKGKYMKIILAVLVLAIGAGIYAYIKHVQLEEQKALAEDIFYQMKQMDLDYAALVQKLTQSGDAGLKEEAAKYITRRRALQDKYDEFIKQLGIYDVKDDVDKAILHIARVFGECEINMPEDFVKEVKFYISEWKKSPRLRQAIARAEENGYIQHISEAMISQNLPPHYFYLGLQESDFIREQVGPQTRFGVAKGMWQFIATTAQEYGLKVGPLAALAKFDPADERHDPLKSTKAAASYIADIYNTEAQASGLLVMASYNWGHNVVKGLIRKMPQNPRDRNFWTFFRQYKDKLPKETYNYVFYIVSAAVIGDNPELFGFKFKKPLGEVGDKYGM